MALASIGAVRTALAVAADTIAGLTGVPYVPDVIEPPTFVSGAPVIDFDQAMGRGLDVAVFACRIYVSRSDSKVGQMLLDTYLAGSGSSSIKTAIETDKTLGGACQSLRVEGQSSYGVYDVAGNEYYGTEISVRVWG